jgi:hypothetical protein
VEAVLLDKSDAIRAAILTISKQEQEALANESSVKHIYFKEITFSYLCVIVNQGHTGYA